MFKNYRELYEGYVDFYSASLSGPPPKKLNDEFQASDLAESLSDGPNFTAITSHANVIGGKQRRLASDHASSKNHLKTDDLTSGYSEPVVQAKQTVEADGSEPTIGSYNSLELGDVALIIGILILLVVAKWRLVKSLANWRWLQWVGMRPRDRDRLDECVWRLVYYSFSSAWLIYTCFIEHNSHLLFSQEHSPAVQYSFEVDSLSYTICMTETSFYLHATYALVCEDVWRRDSPMMLVHHLAAIFSIVGIYATRLTQIGLATIVLRDTCDALLELTKLLKCFHIQRGRRVNSLGWAIKICLGAFTLSFAINQLYYYPLFCLYHALNVIKLHHLHTPVMFGILTCGLVFLLLDCLWFLLILRLLYHIVLSGGKHLCDIREYDDDDEEAPSSLVVNDGLNDDSIDSNKTKRE